MWAFLLLWDKIFLILFLSSAFVEKVGKTSLLLMLLMLQDLLIKKFNNILPWNLFEIFLLFINF